MRSPLLAVTLASTCACVNGLDVVRTESDAGVDAGVDAGPSGTGPADSGRGGSSPDAGLPSDAGLPLMDAGVDAGSDPCPNLAIPPTCFGRSVVYRDWSPTATGDGTYFATQAPWRLGFDRLHGDLWMVKFQVEANTYVGRLAAYGDNVGGVGWISDHPCDATFAAEKGLLSWSTIGGGEMDFAVVLDAADAQQLATNPAYASYRSRPQLAGGHCYYGMFENAAQQIMTAADIENATDSCGVLNSTPDCYYLAFDFWHLLHDPTTGALIHSNEIPGLTH